MRIQSVLIANRGEIACRIASTCSKLGIRTVGIYSIVDHRSRHVSLVDKACCLGLPEVKESYLNIQKIIDIAKDHKVDAIHPGYGFLSEDPIFAKRVTDEGMVFIGPSSNVIKSMGDKIEAKKLANKLNIPTIPGITLASNNDNESVINEFANIHGFPLLVKAAAGGGGRGMKRIDNHNNLNETLESARREAKKFFGDDSIFIEKLLENVKHIEVQILGDNHGQIVHLGTRDCSYQRNNQKIIEEAPATTISENLRKILEESAVRIGKAADYTNAGTVEFLVSGDNYYFIEVNSRLQVEHPVTEILYDIDLVELQLRVASGEELPQFTNPYGHAIECRVCAEVPHEGFRVSTGRINALHIPSNRIDHGLELGTICSHYYDSMVAKCVNHRESREQALEDIKSSLSELFIGGIETNISFLQRLLHHERFCNGSYHTKLIDEINSIPYAHTTSQIFIAHIIYILTHQSSNSTSSSAKSVSLAMDINGHSITSVCTIREEQFEYLDGKNFKWKILDHYVDEEGIYGRFTLDGYAENLGVYYRVVEDQAWFCFKEGAFYVKYNPDCKKNETIDEEATGHVRSPLPGKIAKINSPEGTNVQKGETVMILESMKIEHTITAPFSGVIEKINYTVGAMVDKGILLFNIRR